MLINGKIGNPLFTVYNLASRARLELDCFDPDALIVCLANKRPPLV